MNYQNNLDHSFNTQSLSSENDHDNQNIMQNVTHAKPFSNNLIEIKPHQLTLIERKPFTQTRKNKTNIVPQTQLLKNNTIKLSTIYVENQCNQNLQKQITPKQPSNFIINQKDKQNNNEEKSPIKSPQEIVLNKQESKKLKPIIPKTKKQEKNQDVNKKQDKETPSALLKNQLQESDFKLHIIHKNQFSEATENHEGLLPQVFNQCSHVMKPIKRNYTINHIFNRHQSCALSDPVTFHLPTKNDQVLHSQKISRIFCSQFTIFLNKRGSEFELGTLKSNFTGSIYNFYPKDVNQIYFSIIFSSKKTNLSYELRHCQIYINTELYQPKNIQYKMVPFHKVQSLEGLYILNNQQNKLLNPIIKLRSKSPKWSQQSKRYIMNFGTKDLFPSVKNTIFVNENEKQVMKFYKNSHLTYDISFLNPFSWVLAYGYALASTDFKIATE